MNNASRHQLDVAVSKQFRDWRIEIDFKARTSRLALWGPSGAGKTLTLKLIAGLMKPDAGHIRVNGRTLFDSDNGINLSPQVRRVGMVFQNYALFPHLNVEQNLAFALKRGKSSKREALEMAEKLEISRLLKHYPSQLSGGQCQRVAIGRAVLARPELLLLDEPFSALDSDLRMRLRSELAALLETIGLASVIVTHDPTDAHMFGREVVVLEDGKCSVCEAMPQRTNSRQQPVFDGQPPRYPALVKLSRFPYAPDEAEPADSVDQLHLLPWRN